MADSLNGQSCDEPDMSCSLGDSWAVINSNSLDSTVDIAAKLHSDGSHVQECPIDGVIFKPKDTSKSGSSHSSNSDIAIVDTEEEEADLKESSISCGESLFTFLATSSATRLQSSANDDKDNYEALGEDLSDFSSITSHIKDELNSDVDLNPGSKHYVHVPNQRLNIALNMVVVLAVTAVIGLGVGNFVGWSTMRHRFQSGNEAVDDMSKQFTTGQIQKLKLLQDELLLCIEQQNYPGSKVCLEDTNYWKIKFGALFDENQDLQEMIQKSKCDDSGLKLDLIFKQMDHLRLVKNYEEIRYQEQLSKDRLELLEAENEQLKLKLVEEDQEDEFVLNHLEGKIQLLRNENEQLKKKLQEEELEDAELEARLITSELNGKALSHLEEQVKDLKNENKELKMELMELQKQHREEEVEDDSQDDGLNRIGTLKGQIDQVFHENEELRSLIKSLQEQRRPVETPQEQQQKLFVNELKQENDDLKVEIGKMRYQRYYDDVEDDSSSSEELNYLKEQFNSLQEILKEEKDKVEKWKHMYEDMKEAIQKQGFETNDNNKPEEKEQESREKLLPTINWTDIIGKLNVPGVSEKLGNLGGAVNQILEDIWKMNASMGTQFQDVKEDLLYKWEELKNTINSMPKLQGKDGEQDENGQSKISDALINAMKKLYRTGVKFLFHPVKADENGENRFAKLTGSMKKIMGKLNRKWNVFKEAWKKGTEEEFDENANYEEEEIPNEVGESGKVFGPEEDWFSKRADDRQKHHEADSLPQTKFTDSWELRRAKNRKKQRELKKGSPINTQEGNSESMDKKNKKARGYPTY